jgi:hypothetical protein
MPDHYLGAALPRPASLALNRDGAVAASVASPVIWAPLLVVRLTTAGPGTAKSRGIGHNEGVDLFPVPLHCE